MKKNILKEKKYISLSLPQTFLHFFFFLSHAYFCHSTFLQHLLQLPKFPFCLNHSIPIYTDIYIYIYIYIYILYTFLYLSFLEVALCLPSSTRPRSFDSSGSQSATHECLFDPNLT